jgi:alpha-N-arabinofuranosidase
VSGTRLIGKAKMWRMTGQDLDAANHVGQTSQVEVKESEIEEAPASMSVAPISIEIYRFPVAQ